MGAAGWEGQPQAKRRVGGGVAMRMDETRREFLLLTNERTAFIQHCSAFVEKKLPALDASLTGTVAV